MGHCSARPLDFYDWLTRIEPDLPGLDAKNEVLALDQGLAQCERVGDDADVNHMIGVPDEVLDQRGLVTVAESVAANPTLFQVRGVDGENIVFPFAGRKPRPGVRRGVGRMRAAVHPERTGLFVVIDVLFNGDEFLRDRVALIPDLQIQRAAIDIGDDVDFALIFGYGEAGSIP